MSDRSSFLDNLTKKGFTPPPDGLGDQNYRAFFEPPGQGREISLDIVKGNGDGRIIQYGHVMDIPYQRAPNGRIERLSICCTNCMITVEGRNLDGLKEGLRDHRISYIQMFNPQRFADTPDDDDPVVTDIQIRPLWEGNTDEAGSA